VPNKFSKDRTGLPPRLVSAAMARHIGLGPTPTRIQQARHASSGSHTLLTLAVSRRIAYGGHLLIPDTDTNWTLLSISRAVATQLPHGHVPAEHLKLLRVLPDPTTKTETSRTYFVHLLMAWGRWGGCKRCVIVSSLECHWADCFFFLPPAITHDAHCVILLASKGLEPCP